MPTSSTPSRATGKILIGLLILVVTALAILAFATRLFGWALPHGADTSPSVTSTSDPVPMGTTTIPTIPLSNTTSTDATSTPTAPPYSDYMQQMTPRLISLTQRKRDLAFSMNQSGLEPTRREIIPTVWQKPVRVSTSTVQVDPSLEIIDGPFLRGQISGPGKLAGAKIYSGETSCDGMCMGPSLVLWIVGIGGEQVMIQGSYDAAITPYSYETTVLANMFELPTHRGNERIIYQFTHPALPTTQTLANGKTVLIDQEADGQPFSPLITISAACWTTGCAGYQAVTTTREGFTIYEKIDAYLDHKYMFTEDGAIHNVLSAIPFDAYDTVRYRAVITNNTLKWNAGYTTNTASYIRYYIGGCGMAMDANVMTTKEIKNSELIPVGHTKSGDTLYGLHDPYAQNHETQRAYENWFFYDNNGNKPMIEDFLKQYPIPFFIWKNAFGENVRYVMSDDVPVAECGKPVIYLYPEKTTNVHVSISPKIKVTVSDPPYPTQGWNVVADPNGMLSYQGKTYGSLFWEGTGVAYQVPNEGFLIQDGHVDESLKTILTKYGLNEKESQEFREFWVPKMTGSPYYRASFVTTSDWNKAAPLSVQPNPNTVIRLFMDWEKLSTPIALKEPTIQTPNRQGFTLVEWGGLLKK